MTPWREDPKRKPTTDTNGEVSTYEFSPDSPGVLRVTVRRPSRPGFPSRSYYATPDGRRWETLTAARRALAARA